VDVRQDTTAGNRRANERVELLVSTDGELQVAGGDTLDAQVLRRVACERVTLSVIQREGEATGAARRTGKLENLGGEVLEDGRRVNSRLGTDTHVVLGASLQVTVDSTDGELHGEARTRSAKGPFLPRRVEVMGRVRRGRIRPPSGRMLHLA
jgi:hypothetical protein